MLINRKTNNTIDLRYFMVYYYKMLLVILAILLIPCPIFCESGITGGLGLTHLEQRYVLFERDTISASDEGKAFLESTWGNQFGNNEVDLYLILSGGTETFWGRTKGTHEWTGPSNLKLKTDLALDYRQPYEFEDVPGYYKSSMDFRARKKWDSARGSAKISFEDKRFTSETNYSYDYNLTRARFDFGFPFIADRDRLSFGYQFAFRFAPDTTEANYQRNNFYSSWDYFIGGNYWRIDFEAERRIYNKGDLSGNHWRMYWDIDPKIALGEKLTLKPRLLAESYRYDVASSVYPNRDEISVQAGAEWAFTPYIYAGVSPKYLVSWANMSEADNYREYSLEMSFDWLKYRKIWVDLIIEPGIREYTQEIPDEYAYYSNFGFVEFSVIASYWFTKRLRADLIGIYSPEWHDVDEDDITTLYFSTNLKYEFLRTE